MPADGVARDGREREPSARTALLGVQSVECLCSGTGIYFGRPLVGPVMMTELPASKSSLALSRSRSLSRSLRHAGITLAARLSPEEEEEEEEFIRIHRVL